MMKYLVAFLAVTAACSAQAQAYKCRTPDGRTVISTTPCDSGSRTQAVLQNEHISPEQRQEAQAVHARRQQELERIDEENRQARNARAEAAATSAPATPSQAAPRQTSGDPVADCIRDVEQRGLPAQEAEALIRSCRTIVVYPHGLGIAGDAVGNCIRNVERTGVSGRERARQMALCQGGEVRPETRAAKPAPVETPQPLAITRCRDGKCMDNPGKMYRDKDNRPAPPAGGACRPAGNQRRCD